MKSVDYLKQAKVRLGVESDYALAARLGITRSSISALQKGKTQMSDETAIKVADILEIPRGIVLMDMAMERSRNKEVSAAWSQVLEKFSMGFEILRQHVSPRQLLI